MPRLSFGFILTVACTMATGCSTLNPPSAKALLNQPAMSPDSSALDVFFIRCPMGDDSANGTLWRQVDEQAIPVEVRVQLARNGFRAGLISGQIPEGLSKLLDLAAAPAPADQVQTSAMQEEPQVIRRHMQVRPGARQEIIASEVYEELAVLIHESGQLAGQTYHQAQGLFALRTANVRDGRVRIELVPEMHHGQPRQRWVAGQGMYRLEAGRDKKTFDALTISAPLSPGQMLVMTCLANKPGSLGHHFFSDKRGGRCDQKMLLLRLSQSQHDDILPPTEAPLGPVKQ
jgi:hypothetical protein